MRALVVLIASCALAAASLSGCGSSGPSTADVPTPAEARRDLAGAPPQLAAIHAQANELLPGGTEAFDRRLAELKAARTPAVVNVWASWCDPCKEEFPVLQRASVTYGRSIAFLGVDYQDNAGHARAWLDDHWVSYPSYADGDGKITDRVGVRLGIPGTVFIGSDGEMAYLHQGPYREDADLDRDLQRYLGAKPGA